MHKYVFLFFLLMIGPLHAQEEHAVGIDVRAIDDATVEKLKTAFVPQNNFWKDYQTLISGVLTLFAAVGAIYAARRAFDGAVQQAAATREAAEKQFQAISLQIEEGRKIEVERRHQERKRTAAAIFFEMDDLLTDFLARFGEEEKNAVSEKLWICIPIDLVVTAAVRENIGALPPDAITNILAVHSHLRQFNRIKVSRSVNGHFIDDADFGGFHRVTMAIWRTMRSLAPAAGVNWTAHSKDLIEIYGNLIKKWDFEFE